MTDTPYNMPPLGLFGKRCRILTGYDKRPFVYRIVNSEWMSNTWCEPPITYQSERNPVRHDHSENVLIVVLDTLIDENSRLICVALKDVELMDEAPDNAGWISVKDRLPEAETHVLAACEIKPLYAGYTTKYVCDAFYAPKHTVSAGRYPDDCECYEYDEEADEYFLLEGWYEVIKNWDDYNAVAIADFVTHWMPLPEPPKEETT